MDFINLFTILCWVSFTTFSFIFGYASFRWILNLVWPVRFMTINHYHNDELIKTSKVDLKSGTPLVTQLRKMRKGSNDDR